MKIPVSQLPPYSRRATPAGAQASHSSEDGAKTNASIKSRDGPPHLLGDRIVSLPEASTISGLSVDTLRRCHGREELRIIKLSPRRVGIRLSELWAFIDSRAA
jgi:hypothetical protein